MTRPASHRMGWREHVNRRARQLEAEGRIARRELPGPGTPRTDCPAGKAKWSVRIVVDGHRRTREEAAATFAHQPFASTATPAGVSGPMYVWLIDEALDPRRAR